MTNIQTTSKTRQAFITEMEQKLTTELEPSFLSLSDDSSQHADHFSGTDGHFTLTIRTPKFDALSKVQQHQLVYKILGDYIGPNKGIHALRIMTQ